MKNKIMNDASAVNETSKENVETAGVVSKDVPQTNVSVERTDVLETAELAVRLAAADTFEDVVRILAQVGAWESDSDGKILIWKPDTDTLKYNKETERTSEEGIVRITNAKIGKWCCSRQKTKFGVLYIPQPMPEDCSFYFNNCWEMTFVEASNFDVSNVRDMSWMFCDCKKIASLDFSNLDTTNVTNMSHMFERCNDLTSIDLGDNWDMTNTMGADDMFWKCTNLTTVTGTISNIKIDLDIHHSPLTADSAMVFINGLYDYASEGSTGIHTLTLKSTTNRSLTDEQIAVATKKGWKIATK